MKVHSPFFVRQEFVSPLVCEEIVDNLNLTVPDTDKDDHPIKTQRFNTLIEEYLFDRIQDLVPEIETHFNIQYRGTERMTFEWYAEGCSGEQPHCENSSFVRQKWLRTKDRDLTGILFLSDYHDKTPFDGEFEVYGGKLEFPQHHFGFSPQRGTLIIFPSGPHFINSTTEILAGDLLQVKFHIAASNIYLYNPSDFPGNFQSWLQEFV